MTHRTFPSLERFLCSGAVFSCLAGCSLQDFGYLQSGGTGGSGAGTGGASAAEASAGGAGTGGAATDESGTGVGGAMAVDDASSESSDGSAAELDATTHSDGGPSVLLNPSFELGLTGWSFDPPAAVGKYAYVQFPQGVGAVTIDGQNELATWSGTDAFKVSVFQIPANLPSGSYTFRAFFNKGDGFNAAYIYARNCGGADRRQDLAPTGTTQWLPAQISGIEVTAGQCEVGFYVDSNPSDWLNADAFSFSEDPQ